MTKDPSSKGRGALLRRPGRWHREDSGPATAVNAEWAPASQRRARRLRPIGAHHDQGHRRHRRLPELRGRPAMGPHRGEPPRRPPPRDLRLGLRQARTPRGRPQPRSPQHEVPGRGRAGRRPGDRSRCRGRPRRRTPSHVRRRPTGVAGRLLQRRAARRGRPRGQRVRRAPGRVGEHGAPPPHATPARDRPVTGEGDGHGRRRRPHRRRLRRLRERRARRAVGGRRGPPARCTAGRRQGTSQPPGHRPLRRSRGGGRHGAR
jgi:hypothetical protein